MIIAFLTLILMIMIHEFGHFIAAKILKVPVYEFAIGMGPKICSHKGKSETTYSLRAIPIGGFCSFDKGDVTGIQDAALNKQPIWKRIIILFAGPGFNIISAFIMAIIVCAFVGLPQITTTIHSVVNENADTFFQAEDQIIAVNNIDVIDNYELLSQEFKKSEDGKVEITVLRNNEEITSEVQLFEYNGEWKMGTNMYTKSVTLPANKVLYGSLIYCWETGSSILKTLGGLFTGSVSVNDMSGIVGIVAVMGDAVKTNIRNILSYFIMISINLGIVNLLPIPVLDGSKIVFCIYEAITKKKIPEKFEENITLLFAVLLICLMVYVTFHDIINLF